MQKRYGNKYKEHSIYKRDFSLQIVLLALLLFLFSSLVLSTAFFSNTNNITGTIKLAELDFCITENGVSSNNVLPSQTIQKVISVSNSRDASKNDYDGLCPIFFRFRFSVFCGNILDENLKNSILLNYNENNFTFDGDMFYFNNVLNPGEISNLCTGITFSSDIENYYQNKNIQIEFEVDAIQSQFGAYQEIWTDAPNEWVQIITSI